MSLIHSHEEMDNFVYEPLINFVHHLTAFTLTHSLGETGVCAFSCNLHSCTMQPLSLNNLLFVTRRCSFVCLLLLYFYYTKLVQEQDKNDYNHQVTAQEIASEVINANNITLLSCYILL